MKAERTGWLLLFCGLLLIMTGFISGNAVTRAFGNSQGTAAAQKAVAEVKPAWRGGEALHAGIIQKIRKEFGEQAVTYTVKTHSRQQIKDWSGKRNDAEIAGVDPTWSMFHAFTYQSGGFFPYTRNAKTSRIAVISEDFSYKLFRTHQTVGMELEIYGETFRIAGVYQTKKDLLHELAQPGLPDVLIPAETMLALDNKAYIDSIEVWMDSSLTFGNSADRLLLALSRAGADIEKITITDFVNAEKIIAQRPSLLILAACLMTVVSCLRILIHWVSGLFRDIRAVSADFGPRASLHSVLLKRFLYVILPLGILTVLVFLWVRIDAGFFIPAEYLPGERLEGRKYAELTLNALRRMLLGINEEASVNVKLLQAAGLISGTFFRVAIFIGFILCRAGLVMTDCRSLPGALAKTGSMLLLCLLLACAFTAASGLPLEIYTEGMLPFWLFIAADLVHKSQPMQRDGCHLLICRMKVHAKEVW